MSDKTSTRDFIAFRAIRQLAANLDILAAEDFSRDEKRYVIRKVGRDRPRTDEEIIHDLATAGENCDAVDAVRIFEGLPKKMRSFAQEGIKNKVKEVGAKFYRCVEIMRQWAIWFSGKRYGVVLDSAIASALGEIDVDLSGLSIEIPWSPMLVHTDNHEYFMWSDRGLALFMEFAIQDDGTVGIRKDASRNILIQGRPVEHDKGAIAAWVCAVAKGEGKRDYFELKVGNSVVALLPKIDAATIAFKHKIADDSEIEKGAWVRKGHFRLTKDGPMWIKGAVCRKELPFVHKIHDVNPKGSAD